MIRRCPLCGCRLTPARRTKDHFVPKSKGGSGAPANTWSICRTCNTKKGDRQPNDRETAAFHRAKESVS